MTTPPVPSITDEQLAEIEQEAVDASGGEWFTIDDFAEYFLDAGYLALTSPENILAIISRLRSADADAARYRWLMRELGGSVSQLVMGSPVFSNEDLGAAIDAAMSNQESGQ